MLLEMLESDLIFLIFEIFSDQYDILLKKGKKKKLMTLECFLLASTLYFWIIS